MKPKPKGKPKAGYAKPKGKAKAAPAKKAARLDAETPKATAKAGVKRATNVRRIPRHTTAADAAAEAKRRLDITMAICEDYTTGEFTLETVCAKHGVERTMFWKWRMAEAQLQLLFEKAQEKYRLAQFDGLKEITMNSFRRLVAGYDYEEQTTTAIPTTDSDGNSKLVVKEIKKSKHHAAPSPGMVAMSMKNLHGFRDQVDLQHGGTVGLREVFMINGKPFEF